MREPFASVSHERSPLPSSPMKLSIFTIAFLLLFDQSTKIWVRQNIALYEVIPLLPNFLELTFVENPGVSFSFLADLPRLIRLPLLLSISTLAVAGMVYYLIRYWKTMDFYMKTALVWILPGALGNLIDRAFLGAVTDFLHFRWYDVSFFVNNLADCFISVGVVFFVLSTFLGKPQEPSEPEPGSKSVQNP